MNYLKLMNSFLIKVFVLFFIIIQSNSSFGNENKILFKILNKTYTTIDFENRKKYIKFVGENDNIHTNEILKDYISTKIFYNYYELNKINIDLKNNIETIFNNIIDAKNITSSISNDDKDNIYDHLKYDLVRKSILENFLNNKRNEIDTNKDDVNLMYKYSVKYLNVYIEDLKKYKNYEDILEYNNIFDVETELNKNGIPFFLAQREIQNINKIDPILKNNVNNKNYFFNIQKNNMISFILVKKNFETSEGLITNLYSFESKNKINENLLNCENLNQNNNIVKKEYEYSKLNNKIKEALIDVNDYISFNNEGSYTYVILCEIKFDKELFNNIKINKKVNSIVSKIEENFVNKYSKIYNLELTNE